MSDMWALALGIVFFAVWVAIVSYYSSAHKAYTQGRMDQIRHKNRDTEYKGLPAFLYRRGRRAEAMRYRLVVHSRISGNGYGNVHTR